MPSIFQKKRITFSIIIIAIVCSTLGLGVYFYFNPVFFEERDPQKFFWLRWSPEAADVIENSHEKIDMVSPNWYSLDSDGSLIYSGDWLSSSVAENENIVTLCNLHDIGIHPMISSPSKDYVRSLLENSENQQKFYDNLTEQITKYGLDGINIDFEGFDDDLRDEFNTFFKSLKTFLGSEKLLSIAVPAKTLNLKIGWSGWCDYNEIGKYADMFMIMTYDYSGGWTDSGEVAPTSWVKRVISYAISEVAIEKIYIGIPRYGYDWSEDPEWENWGYGFNYFEDKKDQFGGTTTRTDDGYEVKLEYIDANGYSHVAYYCDATTTQKKEEFLSGYPLGGYCYWYLTSGDPAYFN